MHYWLTPSKHLTNINNNPESWNCIEQIEILLNNLQLLVSIPKYKVIVFIIFFNFYHEQYNHIYIN